MVDQLVSEPMEEPEPELELEPELVEVLDVELEDESIIGIAEAGPMRASTASSGMAIMMQCCGVVVLWCGVLHMH
jgi:hypothetical protein